MRAKHARVAKKKERYYYLFTAKRLKDFPFSGILPVMSRKARKGREEERYYYLFTI